MDLIFFGFDSRDTDTACSSVKRYSLVLTGKLKKEDFDCPLSFQYSTDWNSRTFNIFLVLFTRKLILRRQLPEHSSKQLTTIL